MEVFTLGILQIILLLICRLARILTMTYIGIGVILLIISFAWGLYDRVMSRKEKRK